MIKVGIGGWTYEPWRGLFFPDKLPKTKELFHASRHVTSIEVNGTFYSTFTPSTFKRWADETPDDFIFSLKAPRFAVNRRVLGEAGPSIEKFFASGVSELKSKLSPIFPRNTDTCASISKEVMESAWQRLRWRAELEDVHIHDLRHTVGTYAAQAGVSGFIVRDLLRHANISTTGRYANFDANPVRDVADIVSERILDAGTKSGDSR